MAMTRLAGLSIDIWEGGRGPPLLFLHGAGGLRGTEPFLGLLGESRRIIAPSHPGWGASELPDWMDRPSDIAHLYLDLLDRIGHAEVDVVGCSFGGWIAAELASLVPHRIRALVLVAPCGVRTDDAHLPDMFAQAPDEVEALLYRDPDRHRRDPASMTEDQVRVMQRNRDSFARFGRDPYLHNPKLPHRLHRAVCPTLFVRGAHDGLIPADYTQRYAGLFPDARITTIPEAAHLPQIEQPEIFAEIVLAFLRGEV